MSGQAVQKKLLVVEDDRNISDIIAINARLSGYECEFAFDGNRGYELGKRGDFDLILLDIMLPGPDGFEVCRRLRRDGVSTPVIMLTARAEENDKVFGLELGADDYITKPFSVKELFARITANIRRSAAEPVAAAKTGGAIRIGGLYIDDKNYLVEKNGARIELSKTEYDLLFYLASNPGHVCTKQELLEKVWGYGGSFGENRHVDVSVCRLRAKIEDDQANPKLILNKRGVGYYFVGE